jgi:quercetin dioxygenase-like cupin family protein
LAEPLTQLPIRFCAETLAAEANALPPSAWVPHPTGFAGNDAALLVTPGGRIEQGFAGPMAPTPHLSNSPYIRQAMAQIGSVWGRSRLMRLAPGARVDPHVDTHYYWRTHWRLHIPVVTNPDVRFTCGGETIHMAAGECWLFDSFRRHEVHNGGSETRVHLVLDTVGGGRLWDLLAQAQRQGRPTEPPLYAPDGNSGHAPLIEQINIPTVMSPWEVRCHVAYLLDECVPSPALPAVADRLDRFIDSWTAGWAAYGERPEGHAPLLSLVLSARDDLHRLGAEAVKLRNGLSLFECVREIVFRMAVPRPERATFPSQAARR